MPRVIRCPECSVKIKVSSKKAGIFQCPRCESKIRISAPTASAPPSDEQKSAPESSAAKMASQDGADGLDGGETDNEDHGYAATGQDDFGYDSFGYDEAAYDEAAYDEAAYDEAAYDEAAGENYGDADQSWDEAPPPRGKSAKRKSKQPSAARKGGSKRAGKSNTQTPGRSTRPSHNEAGIAAIREYAKTRAGMSILGAAGLMLFGFPVLWIVLGTGGEDESTQTPTQTPALADGGVPAADPAGTDDNEHGLAQARARAQQDALADQQRRRQAQENAAQRNAMAQRGGPNRPDQSSTAADSDPPDRVAASGGTSGNTSNSPAARQPAGDLSKNELSLSLRSTPDKAATQGRPWTVDFSNDVQDLQYRIVRSETAAPDWLPVRTGLETAAGAVEIRLDAMMFAGQDVFFVSDRSATALRQGQMPLPIRLGLEHLWVESFDQFSGKVSLRAGTKLPHSVSDVGYIIDSHELDNPGFFQQGQPCLIDKTFVWRPTKADSGDFVVQLKWKEPRRSAQASLPVRVRSVAQVALERARQKIARTLPREQLLFPVETLDLPTDQPVRAPRYRLSADVKSLPQVEQKHDRFYLRPSEDDPDVLLTNLKDKQGEYLGLDMSNHNAVPVWRVDPEINLTTINNREAFENGISVSLPEAEPIFQVHSIGLKQRPPATRPEVKLPRTQVVCSADAKHAYVLTNPFQLLKIKVSDWTIAESVSSSIPIRDMALCSEGIALLYLEDDRFMTGRDSTFQIWDRSSRAYRKDPPRLILVDERTLEPKTAFAVHAYSIVARPNSPFVYAAAGWLLSAIDMEQGYLTDLAYLHSPQMRETRPRIHIGLAPTGDQLVAAAKGEVVRFDVSDGTFTETGRRAGLPEITNVGIETRLNRILLSMKHGRTSLLPLESQPGEYVPTWRQGDGALALDPDTRAMVAGTGTEGTDNLSREVLMHGAWTRSLSDVAPGMQDAVSIGKGRFVLACKDRVCLLEVLQPAASWCFETVTPPRLFFTETDMAAQKCSTSIQFGVGDWYRPLIRSSDNSANWALGVVPERFAEDRMAGRKVIVRFGPARGTPTRSKASLATHWIDVGEEDDRISLQLTKAGLLCQNLTAETVTLLSADLTPVWHAKAPDVPAIKRDRNSGRYTMTNTSGKTSLDLKTGKMTMTGVFETLPPAKTEDR